MAITWTGYVGNVIRRRYGFEVELVSQDLPSNSSKVRWRVLVQCTSAEARLFCYWRTGQGGYAQGETTVQANVSKALTSWDTVTVAHDSIGAGVYSSWIEPYKEAGVIGGDRKTATLALPRLYALPLAPSSITVGATLGEISAECAVAAEVRGAPVTGYELQRRLPDGGFAVMAGSGRRGAVPSAGLLDSLQVFRARARSAGGWGPWSAEVEFVVPALAGRRSDGSGGEVVCQVAERYVGGGVWVPCEVVERFDGAAWVQPS